MSADGDAVFEDWYVLERPRVLAAVALWCGIVDVAADATDEAFVRALERWPRVQTMASPTGWVIQVAFNVARRRTRRAALEARLLRTVAIAIVAGGISGMLRKCQ